MTIIEIFKPYEAQNFIAYIALVLAYIAYRKSVLDNLKSWIDLIKSFKSELSYASSWIGNSYSSLDPNWSNPSKIVYPLTFESVKAIIQKGHPPSEIIDEDFLDKVAIFNERVKAFNHILLGQIENYVNNSDPKQAQEKAKYLNETIHLQLIGNQQTETLFWLYLYFREKIAVIMAAWKEKIPFYIKHPKIIIALSFIFYLIVDFFI